MTNFDKAFDDVKALADKFHNNLAYYTRPEYQEAEARADFIDKFFIALGWDVKHDHQHNPYEQEVKVEKSQKQHESKAKKRADYAFFTHPNYKDPRFFVEAKKPSVELKHPDNYFQIVRYGHNSNTPIGVLTDFEQFHIIDCRNKAEIDTIFDGQHKEYRYTDYFNKEIFAEIYWLFSREAVLSNSLIKYADQLPTPKKKGVKKGAKGYQRIDDSFLEYIDVIREDLAKALKKNDEKLDSEQLTEAVTRIIDRLVFIRFLEDKLIEPVNHVNEWKSWKDFIADCRKLDVKYNGVVFKKHFIDDQNFSGAEEKTFLKLCRDISDKHNSYLFSYIPIHILGSIYEQFLGKIVVATNKRVHIDLKPEVRKAGGVYYTPKYIVDYIVQNSVGKIIEGKNPKQIREMRFADIACGSGSFLIGVYDYLLDYHKHYYVEKFKDKKEIDGRSEDFGNIEFKDGIWTLTLKLKQDILINNIFGVDIDRQAVEVTQLSLFLKMLEDETVSSTQVRQGSLFSKVLPDLSKNIICGNSLIGPDILTEQLFSFEEEKKLNPLDYETAFSFLKQNKGFDSIVGNPPYSLIGADRKVEQKYFTSGKYDLTSYKINTYLLFLEQSLKLLKPNIGILGLIIPKSLVFNTYFDLTRKKILENYSISEIVEIREKVFIDAEVGDSILIFGSKSKQPLLNELLYYKVENVYPVFQIINSFRTIQVDLLNKHNARFFPSGIKYVAPTEHLSYFCDVFNGLNPGNVRHILLSNEKKSNKYKKMLLGKDIQRYNLNWSGTWINYDPSLKKQLKPSDIKSKAGMTAQNKVDFALRSEDIYLGNKILVRKTSDHIIATLDTDEYYYDSLSYGIKLKTTTKESIYFFLALLNSRLLNYIHDGFSDNKDKVFAKVLATNLSKLPIPIINTKNKEIYEQLITLSTKILESKKQFLTKKTEGDKTFLDNKISTLERQVDKLVYTLYGLKEEEIVIIEGS